MDCRVYKDLIAAHVDGTLSADERTAAHTHLSSCSRCLGMFNWEVKAKAALKQRLRPILARPGLRQRVLEGLPGEAKRDSWAWLYYGHGWVVGLAALLLLVLPFLSWRQDSQPDFFAGAIARYQELAAGAAATPGGAAALPPAARVLDLSPWGYRVLAKQSRETVGREERLFLYQGAQGEYLLAQEFERARLSPPSGARVIRASNREFFSYSQQGISLVAFREKDLLCILASAQPEERLLDMARQIVVAN